MRRWLTIFPILMVLVSAVTECRGRSTHGQEGEVPFWVTTQKDSLLAESILTDLREYLAEKEHVSVAELMVRAGKALEGQAYVAGTLDEAADGQGENGVRKEEVRIFLTRTDCIIFVETCLALARTAAQCGDFQMFANEIRQSRYRDGRVEAYADRLHYTTEWARQGEARGVLQDVTRALGGAPLDHPVNYMTSHPGSYPLMDDSAAIRAVEAGINSEPRYYIPKSRIGGALPDIRSGDIICLVSAVEGLDIAHVGLALVENGKVRLLHASTGPMKVTEGPGTLQEYLAGRSSLTGIQILRPLDL